MLIIPRNIISWESCFPMIFNFLNKCPGKAFTICCLIMCLSNGALHSQMTDTTSNKGTATNFNFKSTIIVPSVLIGYGLSTMGENGLFVSSQDVYEGIQKRWPDIETNIDDYLVYVPAVAVYGLNLAGVKGKNNFIDRSLIYATSHTASVIIYRSIKRNTMVVRPDSIDNKSMPSGHTTLAFISATFLFEEFKDVSIWIGVAGYSIATATGVIRMLNNKHWMSDVFVGAGLGILVTELTYFVYPVVKGFITSKIHSSKERSMSLSPYYSKQSIGLHLSMTFR